MTAGNEVQASSTAAGAATKIGGVVVGGAGSSASLLVHSEVWEVVRRFSEECPAATFITNAQTPHTLTVHTDYQKIHSLVMGTIDLYQLVLLDQKGNPIFVTKKSYLRRQIRPVCEAIQQQPH